jgi:hypothetical protein
MKWRKPFKLYCADSNESFQSLMIEALADLAKKKGIKLP